MTEAVILTAVRDAVEGADVAVLQGHASVPELVFALRAATAELVLLLVMPGMTALDRAMLLATLEPLALERAPLQRICALDIAATAANADIVAGARFLAGALSTTGQVLHLS